MKQTVKNKSKQKQTKKILKQAKEQINKVRQNQNLFRKFGIINRGMFWIFNFYFLS